MACGELKTVWQREAYMAQCKAFWPKEGRHILAQYDDHTVVVYQAFSPQIADYAVKHQRFGGDHFSFDRMSWIKTNFLWMMYRCGWATKPRQERVLAVRITRPAFEKILSHAYTMEVQKSKNISKDDLQVRLQWDPDHDPNYEKLPRRAIQLGLKGETLRQYGTEWVVQIDDITTFVREQRQVLQKDGIDGLLVARERVYPISDESIVSSLRLDFHEAEVTTTTVAKGSAQ